jgi:Cu(I)/Ag(I) efflux system membrane fusion protein
MKNPSKSRRFWAIALAGGLVLMGGFVAFDQSRHHSTVTAPQPSETVSSSYYTCPMHPQIHEDKPGQCPICGSTLVKKEGARAPIRESAPSQVIASPEPALPAGLQEVSLSPEQQVLANVATARIAPKALSAVVTAAAQITYDEARLAEVTARVDGRIEQLFVDTTGASISRGQPMATIYSPDLVSSMQEDLTALVTYRQMAHGPYADLANGSKTMLEAARQRLHLWGLSDGQIERLERSGKPSLALPLLAPASGVVTKKMVVAGQYVKTGDVLFDIADLSLVWVEADVFENQLQSIKVGQPVAVSVPAYPGKTFNGRVTFIYPFLDPVTRTVKVRAELANSDGRLKPAMYASVHITQTNSGPPPLAVPASAVIDTGKRSIVFVEVQPGLFRPREISLGTKDGDSYAVLGGLKAGEMVAVSGGFLLDANAQIQTEAGNGMAGMAMPSAAPAQRNQPTPATAPKSMPGMIMPKNGKASP